VSDNIVDQVATTHGKLAWHRVAGVGWKALNDAFLLDGAVYQLLREHLRQEPYYIDLLELLHETRHPAFFRNPIPVGISKAQRLMHPHVLSKFHA
jgi:Polyprenyl synthetase